MQDANFPSSADGRTYHINLKPGEAANRILTVGDLPRALAFARLPGFKAVFAHKAPRLYTSITGLYKGRAVTIVTSLMGFANMDFTVRELRHVISGPMAVVRVGTCGTPDPNIAVGDIIVPDEFRSVLRDPDAFFDESESPMTGDELAKAYRVSKPMRPCGELAELVRDKARSAGKRVHAGTGLACCSFYSSQGRVCTDFRDRNQDLVDHYIKTVPGFSCMEMESSHLVDLARCAAKSRPIYAAAAHIALAQRASNAMLGDDEKHAAEHLIGQAALDALVAFELPGEEVDPKTGVYRIPGADCVWTRDVDADEVLKDLKC